LLPADNESSQLYQLVKRYLQPDDIEHVMQAYRFSAASHEGQMRKSGEPYISHPVTVACILAELHLDAQALMAALLHDVLEDTGATHDQLSKLFGRTVAELVDGVSMLDKIEFQNAAHAQAENFRKMLLAMSQNMLTPPMQRDPRTLQIGMQQMQRQAEMGAEKARQEEIRRTLFGGGHRHISNREMFAFVRKDRANNWNTECLADFEQCSRVDSM
jgi:hypothetical protein